MFKISKQFFFLFLSFIFLQFNLVGSDKISKDKTKNQKPDINIEKPIFNETMPSQNNYLLPSGRPCIYHPEDNQGAFYSEITFLYMQTKVTNMPIALFDENPSTFQTKIIYPNFDFEPGFRLLAGGCIPRLNWETDISWTQIYSKNSKELSSDEHKFLPVFYDQEFNSNTSPRFRTISASHNIYFNSVYWNMAKSIWLTPHLILRLHGGVEGDFIKQIFKVDYKNGNTSSSGGTSYQLIHDYEKLTNISKGAGVRIGFDSKWQLFSSELFLLASPTASFILTSFDMFHDINNRQTTTAEDTNINYYYHDKIKEHIWVVRPNAHIILGLDYGHCFPNCYFTFKTAYEVRYFWEQNLNRPSHIQRDSYPSKGDLFLHGLSCSVRLEF